MPISAGLGADNDASDDSYSDDEAFLQEASSNIQRARRSIASWRKEAREAYDFYAGRQWDAEDEAKLREEFRPPVVFNRTAPMVDAVIGTEVNNRHEVKYFPREPGDAGVNEMYSAAGEWVRDNCDAEDEETDAFMDVLICGMGWTETRIDYEEDQDGKIVIERLDPLELLWDIDARKRNLDDRRWCAREKNIPKDEFKARWPQVDMVPNESTLGTGDFGDDEHDADEAWQYQNDASGMDEFGQDPARDTYRVTQYQCRKRVPVYRMLDPTTGGIKELDEETYKGLEDQLVKRSIPVLRQTKFQYHQAFICGQTILERGPCPIEGFTLNPITGKRDRNKGHWFGLVRAMLDPQRWANKFFSQILHIMNTQAKGGIMAEADVFPDIHKVESEWARPDSILLVNPGGIGKIQPKPLGVYPQGVDRLMEFSISAFRDVTGINVEMMGLADRDQPGILETERKKSALAILALMFDSLRRYRKEQGRVLLQFVQRYLPDGTLIKINGDLGQKYIPLIRQPDHVKYDVVVDESPSSTNQKERVWGMLAPMLPELMKIGLPVPPDLLDYMPLPESLAQKWKQMIQQKKEGDPLKLREQQARVSQEEGKAHKEHAAATKTEAEAQQTIIENMMMGGPPILPPGMVPNPGMGAPPPPVPGSMAGQRGQQPQPQQPQPQPTMQQGVPQQMPQSPSMGQPQSPMLGRPMPGPMTQR